nr:MAG TPA: hypothetical protein [Caudoviricetes sp.]
MERAIIFAQIALFVSLLTDKEGNWFHIFVLALLGLSILMNLWYYGLSGKGGKLGKEK